MKVWGRSQELFSLVLQQRIELCFHPYQGRVLAIITTEA